MAEIKIRNVGPIKEAELKLNKINVFMGPQSIGKSTIAKIISYCTWVEKDVATSQSFEKYKNNTDHFKEYLEKYHKLNGYFSKNSYISYKSNVIEFEYDANKNGSEKFFIDWKNQQSKYNYKRSKISYIPSERNMITLPEVRRVEFGDTNIRSFLFEWSDARKSYLKNKELSVLNLGVDYYYNEIVDEDRIVHKNEGSYDILLSNASSGLQSIIPLIVMINYLTDWHYKQEKLISLELNDKQRLVSQKLSEEFILNRYYKADMSKPDEMLKILSSFVNSFDKKNNEQLNKVLKEVYDIMAGLFSTQNSQLIIEEPEQNLFPETQRDLIYYLLEKCLDTEREHRLTITTHSPYILYALNNCMMGYLVNSQLQEQEKEKYLANKFLSEKSWIDPKLVSVWEIESKVETETLRNIQDSDNIISENYFDKKMTELTDEYYQMLNYYKDSKEDEE